LSVIGHHAPLLYSSARRPLHGTSSRFNSRSLEAEAEVDPDGTRVTRDSSWDIQGDRDRQRAKRNVIFLDAAPRSKPVIEEDPEGTRATRATKDGPGKTMVKRAVQEDPDGTKVTGRSV
jgi:hypothetical protein